MYTPSELDMVSVATLLAVPVLIRLVVHSTAGSPASVRSPAAHTSKLVYYYLWHVVICCILLLLDTLPQLTLTSMTTGEVENEDPNNSLYFLQNSMQLCIRSPYIALVPLVTIYWRIRIFSGSSGCIEPRFD